MHFSQHLAQQHKVKFNKTHLTNCYTKSHCFMNYHIMPDGIIPGIAARYLARHCLPGMHLALPADHLPCLLPVCCPACGSRCDHLPAVRIVCIMIICRAVSFQALHDHPLPCPLFHVEQF